MKKIYLITVGLISILSSAFAQSETYKSRADKEFSLFRYAHAAELYLKADTNNIEVISKLGIAYKKINQYKKAAYWMNKQAQLGDISDKFYLDYAETLANNEKYEESKNYYEKYLIIRPEDIRAKNQSKLYEKLNDFKRDSLDWSIFFLSLNTPMDEFSPIYYKKGLIFTSNRNGDKGLKNTFSWNQTPFTDLYLLPDTSNTLYLKPGFYFNELDKTVKLEYRKRYLPKTIQDSKVLGEVSYPAIIKTKIIENDNSNVIKLNPAINSLRHDGPMSLNQNQNFSFFNRNQKEKTNYKNEASIRKLELFSAQFLNDQWVNITPFEYNSKEYSTAHPALSADGNVLYFVSDMPGGYGGKDLYFSVKINDGWSVPKNLGPKINTEGDETFPYISTDGTFYFSSNGHAGLGGLDLFKVQLKNNEPISEVQNLGFPINSSKDDFGFIINNNYNSGYFSSNRYDSDDIFKFNYHPILINLKGNVYQFVNNNKMPLSGALIKLKHGNKVENIYTDTLGFYTLPLQKETEYAIIVNHKDFIDTLIANVSTQKITKTTTIIKDFEFIKSLNSGTDCNYNGTDIKLDHIFYDLDKYNIRNDALPTMLKLLNILQKHPEISLQIKSHTDSRASAAYNEVLSKNRANAVINWLVERGIERTRLQGSYFGKRVLVNGCNDHENCTEDFHQLNRRSELYLFANGKNLTLDCEAKTNKEEIAEPINIDCAFAKENLKLENIFYDLDKYYIRNDALPAMHKLINILRTYPELQLKIKSHTDSRASVAYNLKLSNNRANAVINWLVERGINRQRLTGEYFGKRILVNGCGDGVDCSEDVHQLNRRSEFYLFYKGKNLTIDCNL